MVALTGQVPTSLIGNDAFQEADITGITRPIVKHSYIVKDVEHLAQTIKNAFYIASTGRPGPVVVDLPKDSSQYAQIITKMKEFDVLKITEEDTKRSDMYLGQKKRKE